MAAIVYLATNRINGKRYIGVTSKKLARRRYEHEWEAARGDRLKCRFFHAALRKYGPEAFEWQVLQHCYDYADGLQEEIRLIFEIEPEYNLTGGGQGGLGRKMSDEQRAKQSARMKGIAPSAQTIAKIVAKTRGQKRTPEQCLKFSAARQKIAAEVGQKISAAKKGKKFTDAHRAALSAAHIGRRMSPLARANLKTHFVKGMKIAPEMIERREAARQRTLEAKRNG